MLGEKLECVEFRGFLVLRFLVYNVCIYVFFRYIIKYELIMCIFYMSKDSFFVCYFLIFVDICKERA